MFENFTNTLKALGEQIRMNGSVCTCVSFISRFCLPKMSQTQLMCCNSNENNLFSYQKLDFILEGLKLKKRQFNLCGSCAV